MADFGNSTVFSQTDADNDSGTMPSWNGAAAPSTIDNAGRGLQGAATRQWYWTNYTETAGGTANTKTLTYSVAPVAYYKGQTFCFIVNTTNTGSVTLNVNSVGAKTVKKITAGVVSDLAAGDMVALMRVEVAYHEAGDYFVWTNKPSEGWIFVKKAAIETVNNSASLQADDELLFPIEASEYIYAEWSIIYTTTVAAGFKFEIDSTAATDPLSVSIFINHLAPGTTGYTAVSHSALNTSVTPSGPSAGDGHILIRMRLRNNTDAGNIRLRWAQATATAVDTDVLRGSNIRYQAV